jgi:ATP-dependent Clp protease protease subunit
MKNKMIKKLLTVVVVGVTLGAAGGGLLALNKLNNALGTQPTQVDNQNLDTGMFVDVVQQAEPKAPSETQNAAGVTTLDLTNGNFVLLYGAISDNGNKIAEAVKKASQKDEPVYLLIDSPGGSVITGGAIISAMEASPVPVNTVCLQLCASMGAMIHQYGTKRYTVNRSLLMFHDAAGGLQGPFQQMASRMNMINRFVNKMFANAAKRSGQQYKDFMSRIGSEIWIDGEDAVEQHYSDGIVNVIYNDQDAVNPPEEQVVFLKEELKKKILGIEYIKE